MWAPTTLTKTLFDLRQREVLRKDRGTPYGAVHLRVHFLLENVPPPKKQTKLQEAIQKAVECMEQYSSSSETTHGVPIRTWWILSDDAEVAKNITNSVMERQRAQTARNDTNDSNITNDVNNNGNNNNNNIAIRAVHGYTKAFERNNAHSVSMSQKYSHSFTEASVMDWMTLHESTVAMFTSGAFGETGARGNGKVPIAGCQGLLSVFRSRTQRSKPDL